MAHRVLSHTADTGVEATAESFPRLVEELLAGMFGLMARIEGQQAQGWVETRVSSESPEELVVDALSEALSLAEVEDMVLCEFHVTGNERDIALRLGGVAVRQAEVEGPPIKAVTYHGLDVRRRHGEWYGRVYLDV